MTRNQIKSYLEKQLKRLDQHADKTEDSSWLCLISTAMINLCKLLSEMPDDQVKASEEK